MTRFVPGHDKSKDAPAVAAKPAEPAKPAETKVAATRPALKPSVSDGAGDGAQMIGRSAGGVVELVRQPVWRGEVRRGLERLFIVRGGVQPPGGPTTAVTCPAQAGA